MVVFISHSFGFLVISKYIILSYLHLAYKDAVMLFFLEKVIMLRLPENSFENGTYGMAKQE